MEYALFSTLVKYPVGALVNYDGRVYVFIQEHEPGTWNQDHVSLVVQALPYINKESNVLPDYNLSRPLAAPRYKVKYLINNDDINMPDAFIADNNAYLQGEVVAIQNYTGKYFSEDGTSVYTWIGWGLRKGTDSTVDYTHDNIIMPNHDLVLYAKWVKESTLIVDQYGFVTFDPAYKDNVSRVVLPEYFNGTRLKGIAFEAFKDASIDEIVIPPNIETIYSNAFEGWIGRSLRFVDAEVTVKYPALTIHVDAFTNTPNLTTLVLPYRWHYVHWTFLQKSSNTRIFREESHKNGVFNVYIRNSKSFMEGLIDYSSIDPSSLESSLFDDNNPSINYTRIIHWGYND